ncbi:MAG: M20/M25/M40 family metallo-hydrolase [Planctomycetes bacterium]|nr:M20/M25/M40 family metallo-hydrolase [Planctomycetota bacterium]
MRTLNTPPNPTGLLLAACLPLVLSPRTWSGECIDPEVLRRHVEILASDELGGRDSGEPGLEVAAEYLANQFRALGLEPAGDDGTYFQSFTVPFGADFARVHGAVLVDSAGGQRRLAPWTEVVPFGHGEGGPVDAPLLFAGYGITAGEDDRKAGLDYDDYAGFEVRGKAVIVLRFVPRLGDEKSPFGGKRSPHAALVSKLRNALDHGAAAAIIVTPPLESAAGQGPRSAETAGENDLRGIAHRASPRQPTLPALIAHPDAVREVLAKAGLDLGALVRGIDEDLKPRSKPLEGLRIRLDTELGQCVLRNVAARLRGDGPLAGEAVVVGAHYDHIGRFGGQVAPKHLGQVHNGADDNASGTAGVLELARCLAKGRPTPPARTILFLCFSGEEIGLLGSRAWVDAPRRFRARGDTARWDEAGKVQGGTISAGQVLVATGRRSGPRIQVTPSWSTEPCWVLPQDLEQVSGPEALHAVCAMVNLDMIGRSKPGGSISVLGSGSSPALPEIIEAASRQSGQPLQANERGMAAGGSDHATFLAREVPVLFFFTGMHPQYNTPEDDAATLDYAGAARLLEAVRATVEGLATLPERPAFAPAALAQAGAHGRPRLGVVLDLESDDPGARVEDTVPDTPAAKAGIRAGDVILALGDRPVRTARDLPRIVEDLPEEEEVTVKLRRGESESNVKVLFPQRRSGFRVTFGSVPDYAFAGRGVRFEGIRDGSPAAKAGAKPGDVLLRWNGQAVEDVESWTALLGKHKPGDEVIIEVSRGPEKLELNARLEARE